MQISQNNNVESDYDSMNDTSHSLKIKELKKEFGDIVAVNNVSINIQKGEFFSIIGPSGSGKTTLLRMLGGFETPTDGIIKINDIDSTNMSPHNRDTNMIFQNLALFSHLNVRENIAYGLVESGANKSTIENKVTDILQTVDLSGYEDRKISQLSGGEKQRVALARSLVNEPEVLLLDEPLAALDEKLKEEMKIELKRIQDKLETTFIYVTHDQQVAMAMSDRIAVLYDGNLQQVGIPETIYKQPNNEFVADFTGAENIFDIELNKEKSELFIPELNYQLPSKLLNEELDSSAHRLVIRKEIIDISPNDGKITGEIKDIVYKGSLAEVIIAVENNTAELTAEVHSEETGDISEGDTVKLDWNPSKLTLVRKI